MQESRAGANSPWSSSWKTIPQSERHLTRTDCLILDVRMPGMRGPDLQRELALRGYTIPIVFTMAHGDEDIRPRVLLEGAVDCLLKPFSEEALLKAIRTALPSN